MPSTPAPPPTRAGLQAPAAPDPVRSAGNRIRVALWGLAGAVNTMLPASF